MPSRPVSFPVSFIYYSLESGLESGPHLDRFLSCPILCYMLSYAKNATREFSVGMAYSRESQNGNTRWLVWNRRQKYCQQSASVQYREKTFVLHSNVYLRIEPVHVTNSHYPRCNAV